MVVRLNLDEHKLANRAVQFVILSKHDTRPVDVVVREAFLDWEIKELEKLNAKMAKWY